MLIRVVHYTRPTSSVSNLWGNKGPRYISFYVWTCILQLGSCAISFGHIVHDLNKLEQQGAVIYVFNFWTCIL